MHADGFGNITQNERLHCLVAEFKKFVLAVHNTRCDLHQRFVANFQAAHEPTCFLQLQAKSGVISIASEQLGVLLIDGQFGYARRANFYLPAVIYFSYEYVRDNVFSRRWANSQTRLRVTCSDQNQCIFKFFVSRAVGAA